MQVANTFIKLNITACVEIRSLKFGKLIICAQQITSTQSTAGNIHNLQHISIHSLQRLTATIYSR